MIFLGLFATHQDTSDSYTEVPSQWQIHPSIVIAGKIEAGLKFIELRGHEQILLSRPFRDTHIFI